MKKVIVSGANGFVGSAVVRELVKHEIEVIALDLENNDYNLQRNNKIKFISYSMDDIFQLKDKIEIGSVDTFFNFAWAGSAGNARIDSTLQLNNAMWTVDALKFAKEIGCTRFVNAGSIMEIETYKAVFKAENRLGLGYIYGAGKLVAHAMCKAIAPDIGVDLVWAMITNAYGVGEKSPRLINTTIRKCIKGESPIFTAGTQNYDFVYIDDVAKAFWLIGEKGKPFKEYLIGSSKARPLKEFLLEMQEAIAPELEFVFGDIPFTGVNQPLEDFDCTTTEKDTGFKAEISFSEGCRRTMDWLMRGENR